MRDRRQERWLLLIAVASSFLAAAYYFRTGQVLLYGDAVAHINIARRVVDNLTPGPFQLGTVWLPLPHILQLPFVWNDALWQSGLAGALPSMAAYVIASLGIFRLLMLLAARTAAWIGALFFLLNPNLLYMQATAMTEAIYLAAMIWAVTYLVDFDLRLRDRLPDAGSRLERASIALAAAMMTRYDGWFLAGICAVAALARVVSLDRGVRLSLLKPALRAAALCVATAAFWLAWNYGIFGNPAEFATGPYSAKAIAERTTPKGDPPYPGRNHPVTAAIYFLRSAKLNVAEGRLENVVFGLCAAAFAFTVFEKRRRFALLLWVPLLFYSLSLAYGAVPIFIPPWWPFSYYNVRYGMQLLPALAVFFALASHYVRRVHLSRTYVHLSTFLFVGLAIAVHTSVWRRVPITLREAQVNSVSRIAMEKQLAAQLASRRPDDRILMFTGEYSGALQRARIPFRSVINEGNYGLWQSALAQPDISADIIVAAEGDQVWQAVRDHARSAQIVSVLHASGKRPVTIYRALRQAK